MFPDGGRASSRFPVPMDDDQHGRDRAAVAHAFLHADHAHPLPHPQPQARRGGSGGGSSSTSSGEFRGREFFKTPDLDQRMKKYLVRLANETANHLIRDTLEPEHTSLAWKPVTTVKGIEIFRGYEHGHVDASVPGAGRDDNAGAHNKDATCLRGVARVNATIEEFAMVFKLDTNKRLAEHGLLFNPDLLDMATLYSLVQPSGDHPRRYVGIKWCLVQSPSRIFRNRDFCYLECQKEFRDAQGRRGWVRSMHSIKMPCCPTLEKSHGIVRASLYRCGLIAVETDKPGVLDTTYTIEMDLKGHFPEIFQPAFLRQRIAALASIDKYLQQQRLSSSQLLGDLDIPATKVKGTCHFCFREFSTFNRRHVCRKCGEGVCKHCSDDWMLDIPVIGRKKVRICTVCSAEARYCHATPMSARQTFSTALNAALEGETVIVQAHDVRNQAPVPAQRHSRSLSMSNAYESSNGPCFQTARERQPSMHRASSFSHDAQNMNPSEYFATQYYQHQFEQPRDRRRTVSSRTSDYSVEFEGLHNNGGIRGTADLTGLWDGNNFNDPSHQSPIYSYKQPSRNEYPSSNAPHAVPVRRSTIASEAGVSYTTQRSRAPTVATDPSCRTPDRGQYDRNFEPNRGHFPPSSRYTVVGNRLERANSFDAARHLEEQQTKQNRHNEHQQSTYYGNSRRSSQQIFDHPRHYPQPSPSHSHESPNMRRGSFYSQQLYDDARSTNGRPSYHEPQFAQPASTQSRAAAPPNIALDFVRNMQQAQHPVPAPALPNVALEFVRHMQQPQPPVPTTTHFAPIPQVPFIKFDPPKVPFQPHEPEPPQSPELGGETIEYIESESGEWIASNRGEKGILDVPPFLDLGGGEPLETRLCGNCGAKQYVHEGVVEATCDCETDVYATSPAQMEGFRGDSDLRLSSASVHSDTPHDASSAAIQLAVDIDKVVPLLAERLSRQSLRGPFQNSPPLV